jgi:hypothetical protein
LDIIADLPSNNAMIEFESFVDIRYGLKKQWAGLMYDSLTREATVPITQVDSLLKKIDRIENRIENLINTKVVTDDSKISIDIEKLSKKLDITKTEELKDKILDLVHIILRKDGYSHLQRINFKKEFDIATGKKWLKNLEKIVAEYKWSKYVDLNIVFEDTVDYKYYTDKMDIPYKVLFELYNIYKKIDESEIRTFVKAIILEFNKCYIEDNEEETATEDSHIPYDESNDPF